MRPSRRGGRLDRCAARREGLIVTNDYRKIDSGFAPTSGNQLQATACSRFDGVTAMAQQGCPTSAEECFGILQDSDVKMGITVQHMVMQASTGLLEVRLPGSGVGRAVRKRIG